MSLHFITNSYPYIGLGLFIIWSGIYIYYYSMTCKKEELSIQLQELLTELLEQSSKMIDTLKKANTYIRYLEIMSSSLLEKIVTNNKNLSRQEVIDEVIDKIKMSANTENATGEKPEIRE